MFERFRDLYRYAKAVLNKSRFYYNYVVMPSVLAFGMVDLTVTLILLIIDSKRLLVPSIVLFGILVVALVGMLCALPIVRAREVKEEVKRLNRFFEETLLARPDFEYVLPRSDNSGTVPLTFTKENIIIDSKTYKYDDFEYALYTSNYMYHVNLVVVFSVKKEVAEKMADDVNEKQLQSFSLPLDLNLLSIMNAYNLKLINSDVLAFVKNDTEKAVKQILKYGKVQENYGGERGEHSTHYKTR